MEERIKQLEEKVEFLTIIVDRLTDNQEIMLNAIKATNKGTERAFQDLINKLVECEVVALKSKGSDDEMLKLFDTDEPSTEHQADDR